MNSKRLPNFSIEETKILITAINEKRNIIDCKKLDKYSVCLRAEAWKDIETAFNNSSSVFRPVALLKKKYENLKRELRRKPSGAYKTQLNETGDGPPPTKKVLQANCESLCTISNDKPNGVFQSAYDSGYIAESNDITKDTATWLEENTKQERESNDQLLMDNNEESVELVESKDTAVVELLKEQHEFKVKFMKEEHAFKMKCMQEKHCIEIKILEQQLKNAQSNKKT